MVTVRDLLTICCRLVTRPFVEVLTAMLDSTTEPCSLSEQKETRMLSIPQLISEMVDSLW